MKVIDLLEGINHELVKGNINDDVINIFYDSRKVQPHTAFIALSGAIVDGHNYINDAIKNGATTIFVEKDIPIINNINIIKLDNTRQGLALMSANLFHHSEKKLTTIAITGTKGKTTTSWMIKSILESAGKKVGVIGTNGVYYANKYYETNNTTPESYEIHKYLYDMTLNDIEYLIIEVSSQALKLHRVEGIIFNYGIFTNLSIDHIGENEHHDFEEYRDCKSILFQQCEQGIFNLDDENCEYLINKASCRINTYGMNNKHSCDLSIEDITLLREDDHLGIIIDTSGLITDRFKVSVPGKFSAYNALSAILLCYLLKINLSDIKNGLTNFQVKGRVELIKVKKDITVLIDYAHNGVSLESILTTMREYNPKRLIALFGCGGNRSKIRRYEMGEISGKYADITVVTADNSRFEDVNDIINDITTGLKKTTGRYITIPDRREAIKYCIQNSEPGDIILILGKGQETYQEIQGIKYPFDERIIISDIKRELNI